MRKIDTHPMRQTAKHLIGLVLTLLAVLPMQAQQENAAFYIYQNDGHFDGFFYDEVEKISYSKLDTLGREFDDYVSQEIVTADSTYRFMLSAIDSVGFVQPEIKTNPKLRNMREEGMLDYLSSKDEETMTLTFSASMPESLRPKVGDVLVDFDLDELFGGKVKSVNTSGGITVLCDHLESVHDIYEQYVTVEQYGKDVGGNLVKRRVAGMPEMTVGQFQSQKVRKEQGSYEFNIFNFGLSGHYPVYSSPEGDVNISIDVDVNVAMDVKAVWDFPFFGPDYLSITTTLNNDIGLGFTLDGKVKDIYPLGLVPGGGIPVPANCPLFVITFGPDVFIGGEYHAKLNFQTPKFKGKLWGRLELAGDFKSPKFTFGSGTPPGEQEPDLAKEAASNTWSGSIEFNGFEQCGIMTNFSFGASKLLKWALNTEVAFTTYIGPKVTGALNLSISNVMQDQFSAYNLLKDSKLTFSPLGASYEAKAKMKTLFTEAREWTLCDGSYNLLGDIDLYALPDFEIEGTAGKDGNYGKVNATLKPSRNIIWPIWVGVGLYQDDNLIEYRLSKSSSAQKKLPAYSQFSKEWKESESCTWDMKGLTGGTYELRPIFQFSETADSPIPASPAQTITIPGPFIEMNPQSLSFGSAGGTQAVALKTNCTNLTATRINDSRDRGGQHFQVSTGDGACTVSVNPLHGIYPRKTIYRISGDYAEDEASPVAHVDKYIGFSQEPDGQFNRMRMVGSGLQYYDPIAIEGSTSGNITTVHAHKDAKDNPIYPPSDFYDMNMKITMTEGEYDRRSYSADFTGKYVSNWAKRTFSVYDDPKMCRVTLEFEGHDISPFMREYGDNGLLEIHYTYKQTITYADYDEEQQKYVISDEKTYEPSGQSLYLWYEE